MFKDEVIEEFQKLDGCTVNSALGGGIYAHFPGVTIAVDIGDDSFVDKSEDEWREFISVRGNKRAHVQSMTGVEELIKSISEHN